MSLPIIILLALAAIVALVFSVVRITHGGVASLLWKTFASFCFVLLGVVAVFEKNLSPSGMFVIMGLICGLIGDVLLDLKSVDATRGECYLNFGMLAFGIGHAFYIVFAVLLNQGTKVTSYAIWSAVAAVLFTIVVIFFSNKLLGLKLGKFVAQASSYACILTFTSAFCVALCFANAKMLMLAIAMVAFWLSDVVLSVMYFGGKKDNVVLSIANHVLYYGAQIAIALFTITL